MSDEEMKRLTKRLDEVSGAIELILGPGWCYFCFVKPAEGGLTSVTSNGSPEEFATVMNEVAEHGIQVVRGNRL